MKHLHNCTKKLKFLHPLYLVTIALIAPQYTWGSNVVIPPLSGLCTKSNVPETENPSTPTSPEPSPDDISQAAKDVRAAHKKLKIDLKSGADKTTLTIDIEIFLNARTHWIDIAKKSRKHKHKGKHRHRNSGHHHSSSSEARDRGSDGNTGSDGSNDGLTTDNGGSKGKPGSKGNGGTTGSSSEDSNNIGGSNSGNTNESTTGTINGNTNGSTGSVSLDTSTEGWSKANLTNFTSYPAAGSDECVNYSGCEYEGQFSFVDGTKPLSWVQSNNIIAVHSKDAQKYKLKTFTLRQGTKQINAIVYDECADSDCNGCCTKNATENGLNFLIDIEKNTMDKFGIGEGIVEWKCIDC